MQLSILKSSAIAAVGLLAFTLVGTAWGQMCVPPEATYPHNPNPDDIPAPLVTDFDGNMTCDNIGGQFGGIIPGGVTPAEGTTFQNPNGPEQFTVISELNADGIAEWQIVKLYGDTPPMGVVELDSADTALTAASQGGNGCLYSFGADANFAKAAWEKSNGTYTLRNLYVCADTKFDGVAAALPRVEDIPECVIDTGTPGDGTVDKLVKDVGIDCPAPNAAYNGSNERLIIIGTTRDEFGVKVPFLGFRKNNDIDASAFCVCNKKEGPDKPCDPNLPAGVENTDPNSEYFGLFGCALSNEALPTPVVIELQNPTCVGAGSSRRCW